jgi:hypothetical protein
MHNNAFHALNVPVSSQWPIVTLVFSFLNMLFIKMRATRRGTTSLDKLFEAFHVFGGSKSFMYLVVRSHSCIWWSTKYMNDFDQSNHLTYDACAYSALASVVHPLAGMGRA